MLYPLPAVMVSCGRKDFDKFKEMHLPPYKSDITDTPAIAESPVNIYCKVKKIRYSLGLGISKPLSRKKASHPESLPHRQPTPGRVFFYNTALFVFLPRVPESLQLLRADHDI